MKAKEKRALDRMLGLGRLPGPEKDRIWAALRSDLARSEKAAAGPVRRRWLRWSPALAAATALGLVLVFVPDRAPPGDEFLARGAPTGVRLRLECETSCAPGESAVVRYAQLAAPGYLAVWHETAAGERMLVLPADQAAAPALRATQSERVARWRLPLPARGRLVAAVLNVSATPEAIRHLKREDARVIAWHALPVTGAAP